MAAFKPTSAGSLRVYDLYPPGKVVSCFKGAVPPLTNSLGFYLWVLCWRGAGTIRMTGSG